MTKTIKASSAEDRAYSYIKQKIISKELLPLEQIVETEIAFQTGISRTPIRSAIKKLGYEGLLTIKPNKGAFVVSPSAKEVRDIFACKKLLETEAIRLACENITDRELKQMEKLVKQEPIAFKEKDFSSFLNNNYNFHMTIAKASNNSYYTHYIDELMTKSNVFLIFFDDFMSTTFEESDAHKEHLAILQALQEHDLERCVKEMAWHGENTYETLKF